LIEALSPLKLPEEYFYDDDGFYRKDKETLRRVDNNQTQGYGLAEPLLFAAIFGWKQNQLAINREGIQFDMTAAFAIVPCRTDTVKVGLFTGPCYTIGNQLRLSFLLTHGFSPFPFKFQLIP
jgi:hypothetical protein